MPARPKTSAGRHSAALDDFKRRPDLQIRRTKLGRGLFAGRHYRQDEVIGEITGEIIADSQYTSRHCFDLDGTNCLEPAAPFRFMNHSCGPNCEFRMIRLAGDTAESPVRLFVLAIEPLRPGDELTIDYAWPPAMAIPCRCGDIECRGWIVAEDELQEFRATREAAAELM